MIINITDEDRELNKEQYSFIYFASEPYSKLSIWFRCVLRLVFFSVYQKDSICHISVGYDN